MADHHETAGAAPDPRRRRFLFTIGTGGIAAAAAAMNTVSETATVPAVPAPDAGSGYRETDHVRDYYRTAKT